MCSNNPGIELEPALETKKDKVEHISSYAHVVHTTTKHVISRRRKNENVFKMSKNEKCTCEACKILFFIVKYGNLWGFCCRRRRGCFKLCCCVDDVTELTYFHVFFLSFANRLYQFNSKTRNFFIVEIRLTPELV